MSNPRGLSRALVYSAFGGQHRHTLLCGPTTCAARFQLPLTKVQGVVRTRLDALGKFVGIVLLYFCGVLPATLYVHRSLH